MSERVDICKWLRDFRHSPAVRETCDVGRGLHLAETEIVSLRAESARLRLTDAERYVLREVRDIYADEDDIKCNEIAFVLDDLLARHGDPRA